MAKNEKKTNKGKNGKKPLTVNELDSKLIHIPFTSSEYKKILEKIQKREKESYGDQHILCIDSRYLKDAGFETSVDAEWSYKDICNTLEINNFNDSNNISQYLPRYMVEYDYRYKQVLTFGYITNRNRDQFVLLRKNGSQRLGMIGGHTDFSLDAYSQSPTEFLINNLYKELFEEVGISDLDDKVIKNLEQLNPTTTFKMFINENTDTYKLRNVGFIYEILLDVDDLKKHYRFFTNEPKVHDVELVGRDVIEESQKNHTMVKHILNILDREVM